MKKIALFWIVLLLLTNLACSVPARATPLESSQAASPQAGLNPNPPEHPVKLIFIHHSTGEAWLSDDHGGVGWILGETNPVVRGLMGLGNVLATFSTMSSVLADAKTGDSRLQMQVFSINGDIKIPTTWTLNASTYVSVTTTAVGWVAPITEESLFFQSIALVNDYGTFSPFSLSYP